MLYEVITLTAFSNDTEQPVQPEPCTHSTGGRLPLRLPEMASQTPGWNIWEIPMPATVPVHILTKSRLLRLIPASLTFWRFRITSYNVCYTKLLRPCNPDLSGFFLLLACPQEHVATPWAFRQWDEQQHAVQGKNASLRGDSYNFV